MGVKATRPITLDFTEEGPYQGARIVLAGITVGDYFGVFNETSTTEEMIDFLGGKLRDWNIEDEDGTPLAKSVEGLKQVGPDLLREIFEHLNRSLTEPSAPLGKPSPSGSTTLPPEELTIPMASVGNASLQNLDVRSSSSELVSASAASPANS